MGVMKKQIINELAFKEINNKEYDNYITDIVDMNLHNFIEEEQEIDILIQEKRELKKKVGDLL